MKTMSSKKKAKKNSGISQFFRDRMQSHRQSSPLVVETGFPASLVDLIIKNRQRLRRSSEGFLIQEPLPSPPTTKVSNHVVVVEDDAVQIRDAENCRGFLPAVLIMCVVSVLALGAKKFALGLTMSAFFLILMESMGKSVFGLLIPCHDLKTQFRLMKVKILTCMGSNGSEIEVAKSECSLAAASVGDVECKETEIDRDSKLRKLNSLSAFLEEEDEEEQVSELKKKKKWHKAKMKAKLKHIFARKEKKRKKTKKEEEESNVGSSERSFECVPKEAVSWRPEEEQKKKCNNSGCLIVCAIVLIGLSGGRMHALLLILSCCLLKKSGCGVFMIKHFFPDV